MSWINDLYDTYEQNFDMKLLDFTTDATPLPISHSSTWTDRRSGSPISTENRSF